MTAPIGEKGSQFVYFIHCVELDAVKIGISAAPRMRLRNLQTAHPYKLHLFGSLRANEGWEEPVLHHRFRPFRLLGEWFKADVEEVMRPLNRASEFVSAWDLADLLGQPLERIQTAEREKRIPHCTMAPDGDAGFHICDAQAYAGSHYRVLPTRLWGREVQHDFATWLDYPEGAALPLEETSSGLAAIGLHSAWEPA